MKKIFLLFCISVLLITIGWFVAHKNQSSKALSDLKKKAFDESLEGKNLKDGDIIFQTSLSSQSKAIQLATGSKYSHCGIIFKQGDDFFVIEAIQPVKSTPLMKWIERGENGKFVVKRLKNAEEVLNEKALLKMKDIGNQFTGKDYDINFEWSDNKIYCSELIWKIYKRGAGLEIGKLEKIKDYDFTNPKVQQKAKERYGNNIPEEEMVISPVAIFNSPLLFTVASNE